MNSAKEKYSKFRNKIFSIYPGAKQNKEGVNNSTSTALKFSYIGSLYQTRNLDNFLKAFSEVSKKLTKNTVLIYTAGLQMM